MIKPRILNSSEDRQVRRENKRLLQTTDGKTQLWDGRSSQNNI